MEGKILYSVIVPVYNAEKCLDESINSILKQTEKNFELILVDDGSTDNSLDILKKFSEFDNRIIIIHKENGGVSSARNAGINIAKGKYIVFVDSDDIVDKELLKVMETSSADLVMVGFNDYDTNKKVSATFLEQSETYEVTNDEKIIHFIDSKYSSFVWGKRYKREIIIKNNIIFNINHRFSEDILFNNEYILKSENVEVIEKVAYHHCHYTFDTLGSVAWKYPLIKRIPWIEEAYNQFTEYPQVQEKYIKMFLYLSDKEFTSISKSNESCIYKRKKIQEIITHPFFEVSICKYPKYYSSKIRFCLKFRAYFLLILVFKKH